MARVYGMALLAAISVAYLIHSSSAQTTYTVGDTTGWTVPQNGAAFYSTCAANKTFKVGDILVFNYAANSHDVAKVTKADYDACSSSSPITLSSTPPVRIPINASGEHYFFCTFPGHCTSGQKSMITVSDASPSPAPQPSTTPAPQPSTPTPSSSPPPASTPPHKATKMDKKVVRKVVVHPTDVAEFFAAGAGADAGKTAGAGAHWVKPPNSSEVAGKMPNPPAKSSATSLGFAGFTTFLSIFVALCF